MHTFNKHSCLNDEMMMTVNKMQNTKQIYQHPS
jgi:hypothetical protein